MNIMGYDVETTGLDVNTDRIIEIGAVAWDVDGKQPLDIFSRLVKPDDSFLPLSEHIQKLTGIKNEVLVKYGNPLVEALADLDRFMAHYEIEYVVAHNGINYDKPLSEKEVARVMCPNHLLIEKPWIDTRIDIEFDYEPDSRRLKHLALDHGFMNPFEHRAVFDVCSMLKVLSFYDVRAVAEQSRIPMVTIRALTEYAERDKAKAARFNWDGEKKIWTKQVRLNKWEAEVADCLAKGFKAVRL